MRWIMAVVFATLMFAAGCSCSSESSFAKATPWDVQDTIGPSEGRADEPVPIPTDVALELKPQEATYPDVDAVTDALADVSDVNDITLDVPVDLPYPQDAEGGTADSKAEVPDAPCDPVCEACGADDGCGNTCSADVLCDDGNPCTDDVCDPVAGCSNPPNQLPCDDGDWCTENDLCNAGVCEGIFKDCPDGEVEGCVGLCAPETGECVIGLPGGAFEVCDGLDNDCDGLVDEELDEDEVWKIVGGCVTVGVCNSEKLEAVCMGADGWHCFYEAVDGYVPDETFVPMCDGLDNDCDGAVDELACDFCEPCEEDGQCIFGACNSVPSTAGDDKYCSLSNSHCVFIEPGSGECDAVQSGEKACGTEEQACVCNEGLWFCDIPMCQEEFPACYQGECVLCVPLSTKCEGQVLMTCNAQGMAWSSEAPCGAGQICAPGPGCIPGDEMQINIQDVAKSASSDVKPRVARRKGGGFAVVWESNAVDGAVDTELMGRVYDENYQPLTSEFIVNLFEMSSKQEEPDIAAIPTDDGGFVVVWQDEKADGDNDGWGISGQLLTNDGALSGQRFRVNDEIEGDQTRPRVAVWWHAQKQEVRLYVAWENDLFGEDGQPDVFGRLWKIDADGVPEPLFADMLVTPTIAMAQRSPAVADLDSTGFVTAWASNHIDTNGIYQSVNGGPEEPVAEGAGSQKNPSVAGFIGNKAGGHVVAWDSYGNDGDKTGVFMQLFPEPLAQVIPVNNIWTGQQREPEVAVVADNDIVVTWESEKLNGLGDSDNLGVVARQFDENGFPVQDDEFLVNQTTAGDQRHPHLARLEGGVYVVVWASAVVNSQGPDYDIYARLFAPE